MMQIVDQDEIGDDGQMPQLRGEWDPVAMSRTERGQRWLLVGGGRPDSDNALPQSPSNDLTAPLETFHNHLW